MRPTTGVGQKPTLWLLFAFSLRKLFKIRYLSVLFMFIIVYTYIRLLNGEPERPSSSTILTEPAKNQNSPGKCRFNQIDSILSYQSKNSIKDDGRAQPSVERLIKLFRILISFEEKFESIFDYLEMFRFTNLHQTLRPYANQTENLPNILCMFQRYITVSDNGHIDVSQSLLDYLKQVSLYLSDGFKIQHPTWNDEQIKTNLQKPVIILGANARFYDNLQASMRTVNEFFPDHRVVVYDLGFDRNQVEMIRLNCQRCLIIAFPFDQFREKAAHVSNLPNFSMKPIIVQDAVRRFGSIIYGDTSVRYMTSDFHRILVDNMHRGFSCRELPGHYLSCFTLTGTFSWFNETSTVFDDIYIAEAGFVAVTDNFLSRLVLKTWVTCALDPECIAPSASKTTCSRIGGPSSIHRFDQSAMVAVLSFFFYQSQRRNDQTEPAPYDMYSSIQQKVAEVRRFEGDPNYFTRPSNLPQAKVPSENKEIPKIPEKR